MNKTKFSHFISVFLFSILFTLPSYAQLSKNAWVFGFGFHAPKISATPSGFGGYLSIQRNFSEHTGFRFSTIFGDYKEEWSGTNGSAQITSTSSFQGNLDLLYYFFPCEWFSPYFYGGLGLNLYTVDNPEDIDIGSEQTNSIQVGVGLGSELSFWQDWKIKGELGFYSLMTDEFDGKYGPEGGGVFGTNTDSFAKLDLGVQWYFSRGEPSKICQLYDGLEQEDKFNYDEFERMLDQNIPAEIVTEKTIIKTVPKKNDRMLLLGVGFEFNSSTLTSESYPVLYHASELLKENPSARVEIEGHCDSIGTDNVNQRISQERADVVKNYLVERGVKENQITAVGYGSTQPIADNNTEEGRAINRRIEFRVVE